MNGSVCIILVLVGGLWLPFNQAVMSSEQVKTEQGESTIMQNAEAMLKQADNLFNASDYEQAKKLYENCVEKALGESDVSTEVQAYSQLARISSGAGDLENAKLWLAKAQAKATDKQPLAWSQYLGARGRYELKSSGPEAALKTFEAMYDYCSKNKLHQRAIDATHMIAIVVPPEEQVAWARKGIAEAEAGKFNEWLGPLWNNLGATFEDLKQFDQAIEAYLKARNYHWQFGAEINKLIADWAVGHAYRLAGKYEEAQQWLRPVIAWAERLGNKEYLGWALNDLAEITAAQGNAKEAAALLQRALELLDEADIGSWGADLRTKLAERLAELQK